MRKTLVLMIVVLLIGIMPAAAQDDDTPFMQMLARIPDTDSTRAWLTYIDYQALIAARQGTFPVTSWAEFELANDFRLEPAHQVMQALIGIQSGPSFFTEVFATAKEMPETVGFDVFQIGRAAEFGLPPAFGTILEGDFDSDTVIATHTARDYTVSDAGDLTLLCGANGCDSGMNVDIANRSPANPFGGRLGRSQPVLVGDQLVASSPSIDVLDQTADTINGDGDSIAADPDYSAAAEAISAGDTVLQAYFINPGDIPPLSEALLGSVSDPAAVKTLRAELARSFVPLPPYNLIAISDSANDSEQIASLALVYTDEADAEAAAALFPAQVMDFNSFAIRRSFGDLLTERGVTSVEASVFPASGGRSVMLLTLHGALPDADTPSSMVFRLLVQAYFMRDLAWLATEF